ncbi:N-acetyl-gamma-glutamyl-phosphate reductase [Salinibacter altiplanensis]|uniref:N-acetyl-gamma-glutamyl-phosphate reductase n=1 Tax=Salinibacter altiplanensis TaxID=1803181 RepID=UPI000C9F7E2B|nr:N-acetyl-gamma-glutamyl-phosphate reductase [Salinibacter altiplanensis]
MTLSSPISTGPAPETAETAQVGLLHGAGYVGGELIRLLAAHPHTALQTVTSRTFADQPIGAAHPSLQGQVNHTFAAPSDVNLGALDALLVAAEHGQSMRVIPELMAGGFDGSIVDLSADFRFSDPAVYPEWFDTEHPAPELLNEAVYGLPEWSGDVAGASLVANPGCYATGITLALAPLAQNDVPFTAHVTVLTGASGSGATPSAATHFPDRDGNVRPYKVLDHQHGPEIQQTLGPHVTLNFVPASGPWARGIWGTAQIEWKSSVEPNAVAGWYKEAYGTAPCVRCSPGLPSLQPTVHTPFCDLGWKHEGTTLVVGFALDNLLKGAASQAIQNLNRALGLPKTAGLLPPPAPASAS